MRKAKILFFVDGFVVSDDERQAASKLDAQVCFRNVKALSGPIETCDGVAGKAPENYAKAFPDAAEAIAKFAQAAKSASEIVGGAAKPATKAKDSKAGDQGHSKD